MKLIELLNKLLSPLALIALKLHTFVTKQERARILVLDGSGKILLVRGLIGFDWALPGGGINRNEAPKSAAIRELREETGIIADELRVRDLGRVENQVTGVGYTAHLFVMELTSEVTFRKTPEIITLDWFDIDTLPDRPSPLVAIALELLSKKSAI